MERILLIQFRENQKILNHEKRCLKRFFPSWILETQNILEENNFLKPKELFQRYQGVILGGSGLMLSQLDPKVKKVIKKIKPLVDFLLENDFPTLGVCFGHQLLGYFLGSRVIRDERQIEVGTFEVFLTKEGQKSQLFAGLPKQFLAQFGHKDSLEKLPQKAYLLAFSKRCKIAAFGYQKNIFGVQWHPELEAQDLVKRLKGAPEYCPEGLEKTLAKIKETPLASKILENFAHLVVKD